MEWSEEDKQESNILSLQETNTDLQNPIAYIVHHGVEEQ